MRYDRGEGANFGSWRYFARVMKKDTACRMSIGEESPDEVRYTNR